MRENGQLLMEGEDRRCMENNFVGPYVATDCAGSILTK